MAAQISRKYIAPFRRAHFQVSTLAYTRLQRKFSSLESDQSPQSGLGRRRWFSHSIILLEALMSVSCWEGVN